MFNFRTFVKQALLAATLAFGIGNASAGPTYHVDINTSQFSGLGSVDFVMSGFFGASGAIATVSNFTGALGEEFDRSGSVVGALPASVSLANTMMFNSVSHDLTLGGMFGFDVSFSGDFLTVPGFGSTFSVSIYDALGDYLTQSVSVVEFSLIPYSVDNDAAVRYTTDSIVRVAVPEPSDLLLVLTGLGLVAFVRRRATRAAR